MLLSVHLMIHDIRSYIKFGRKCLINYIILMKYNSIERINMTGDLDFGWQLVIGMSHTHI